MTGFVPSFRARWTWFAGSTNDCALPHLERRAVVDGRVEDGERPRRDGDGDRCAVRVPAEAAAGRDRDLSKIIEPVCALIVVACIVPTASGLRDDRRAGASDGAAIDERAERERSETLISCRCLRGWLTVREER